MSDNNWHTLHRFTNRHGGPAYIDLVAIVAIVEMKETDVADADATAQTAAGLDGILRGSLVYLAAGNRIYVQETPEVVFDLSHKAKTQPVPRDAPIRA